MSKPKKFRNYFFEFITIGLAVLLSFEADNYRERLKDKKLERFYIEGLTDDLRTDIDLVSQDIKRNEDFILIVDSLMIMLANPDQSHFDKFLQLNINIYSENYLNPSRAIYDDLISSGNLKVIRNRVLKKQIQEYYLRIEDLQRNNDASIFETYYAYVYERITLKTFSSNTANSAFYRVYPDLGDPKISDLAKDHEYLHALTTKKVLSTAQNMGWKPLVMQAETLISSLETELSK